MADQPKLIPVPFHGDTIMTIETPDERLLPIKPICTRLGLSVRGQMERLQRDPEFWGGRVTRPPSAQGGTVTGLPSAGGTQEMFCIPINRVAAFLFTITVSRVRPEIREALSLYRKEAADVLDRHFRLRAERRDAQIELLEKMLWRAGRHLLLTNAKWAQAYQMMELGMSDYLISRRLNWSMDRWSQEKSEMMSCGLNPKCRDDMEVSPRQMHLGLEG